MKDDIENKLKNMSGKDAWNTIVSVVEGVGLLGLTLAGWTPGLVDGLMLTYLAGDMGARWVPRLSGGECGDPLWRRIADGGRELYKAVTSRTDRPYK